jgi:hypothetical protein
MHYVHNCAFLHVHVLGLHYMKVQNTGVNAEPFLPTRIYKQFFLQRHNLRKPVSRNSTILFQYMKTLLPAKKFFAFMVWFH